MGEEAAQYGFSFPLWVQAPDGTSYCLVLDQAEDQDYAAPGTLFAVSSQGAALWRARVEPGFRLLAATDSGLLYALERLHTTSHDAFSAHAEADVVCLDVMPPAPAR